ncbi:MAG: hypothetical protein ACTTIC_04420 [Helicobacteraceae bacterium]
MQTKNYILFAKQELFFGLEAKSWIFVLLPVILLYNISIFLSIAFLIPSYLALFVYCINDKDRVSIALKRLSLKARRYVF